MKRTFSVLTLAAFLFASVAPASAQYNDRYYRGYRSDGRSERWSRSVLPAGTTIDVRLNEKITTEDARPGDQWTGTVVRSVAMIPAGTPVSGVITVASQGTHNSKAELGLAVREVMVNGRSRVMNADTEPIIADSHRAKKIGAIAIGAGAGALVGSAIGDKKGGILGGLLGGAAGYGLTRHALRTMQLKEGTVISFTTRDDVAMRRF